METSLYTNLVDSPDFFQAFEEEVRSGKHRNQKAAYEALEALRNKHFGRRKFKSYLSFRNSRDSYAKRTISNKEAKQAVQPL